LKQLTLQFYSESFDLLARSRFYIRDMETAEHPYWVVATVGLWWAANTIATIEGREMTSVPRAPQAGHPHLKT